jgi:hypothetical protein
MLRLLLLICVTFLAVEAFARAVLGLGNPPLFQKDDFMEYRLKSNQNLIRFGNTFQTNEWGMRSPSILGEHRNIVMVLGDSVLNGGAQVGQSYLATSLLSNEKTVFANYSAPSWGPANILAALNSIDEINFKSIILVLNGDDLFDVPKFGELSADQPEHEPVLAIWEAATRYLPRYIPNIFGLEDDLDRKSDDETLGRMKLNELLIFLSEQDVPACVVLHPRMSEVKENFSERLNSIRDALINSNIRYVDSADFIYEDVEELYIDDIHLNQKGQIWLSKSIRECSNYASSW